MTAPTPSRAMARTADQIVGADPAVSAWVSANAGTGKTGVLVDRIARLLLAGTRPERILCLTFTKAAAAEMAIRLGRHLGRWAVAGEANLVAELAALLGRPATTEEAATARRLFAEILDAPEGMRIRTIHAFCESLLGRFPLEAGISPDFRVIDERATAELTVEARDRVLSGAQAGHGTALGDAMDALAGLVDEDRFARVMAELDAGRDRFGNILASLGGVDGTVAAARTALGLGADETRPVVLAAAVTDAALDRPALEQLATAWGHGAKTDKERSAALTAWLARPPEARAATYADEFQPLFLSAEGKPRKESRLVSKGAREADGDAVAIAIAAQARAEALLERLRAVDVAEATAALIRIGAAIMAAYADLKRRRAQLDYDDLIAEARRLLGQDGGVGWVHYKLDGGIEHVLVDEAQDTSPAQWAVIEALTTDFFAGGGRHEEVSDRPRTVFAVGDEKQSIYSFQGADPRQLARVGDRFAARACGAGLEWKPVAMLESFRSTDAVLRVVDRVFAEPAVADGLSFAERPIRHLSARRGEAGLVELWPTVKPEDTADEDPWDAPLDQPPPSSPANRLAERIADTICRWVDDGEILESEGRPIRWGDVMILVRTRRAFAEEMVRALKARGIPVAGRDRMVLTRQLAIMDLVAVGRFVLLPDDDLNTATVLKGPFCELDDDQLFRLCHDRPGTVWQALIARRGDDAVYARAYARLAALRARADFAPPYEFFARLLGPEGGRRDLIAHLGEEAVEPIDEFLTLALEFERDHVPSLEGFLAWLERGETEVKRDLEHGRGEVRVLTVHGAKGLQAGIVFLPDTCRPPGAQSEPQVHWTEPGGVPLWPVVKAGEEAVCRRLREAERAEAAREYRRLLYVAMTRARDRLYVCGFEGRHAPPDDCWYRLVRTAMADIAEPVDDTDDPVLRLADRQTVAPGEPEPELVLAGGRVGLPEWATVPPPAEPDPPRPLAPSLPVEADPPVASPLADDRGARFRRGLLIHGLLQHLPEVAPERRGDAAAAYLDQAAGDVDAASRTALAGECLAVLAADGFGHLFGADSRAEVPLAGLLTARDGTTTAVAGQVDRLVVGTDAVTVVDYKTNRPAPQRAADTPPAYLRQMAAYRALLRDIFPGRRVDCVLLWTDGPRLMPLAHDILDAHAP